MKPQLILAPEGLGRGWSLSHLPPLPSPFGTGTSVLCQHHPGASEARDLLGDTGSRPEGTLPLGEPQPESPAWGFWPCDAASGWAGRRRGAGRSWWTPDRAVRVALSPRRERLLRDTPANTPGRVALRA